MTTNLRQQVVDAVDTRLRTILTTGGYETNIGAAVKWWEPADIDPDVLPVICCRDIDRPVIWAGMGEHLHELDIMVEVYLKAAHTAWAAQNYTAGQVIVYGTNNKIYLCILSTTTSQVPTNATYWREVSTTYAAAVTLRKVIADLIKCIGVDPTWGLNEAGMQLAQDTLLPDEGQLHIQQQEHMFVAIGWRFAVQFITEKWNAYQ